MPVNEAGNEDPDNGADPSESPITHNDSNTIQNNEEGDSGDVSGKGEATIDESSRLRDLQADIRDQDDLERDIGRQVDSNHSNHHSNYGN